MKKVIILAAISLFFVPSAFAAGTLTLSVTTTGLSVYGAKSGVTITVGDPGVILIGKTSTGVGVGMSSADAGYSVETQHKNGTKAFGSSFDSTSIYTKDVTAGTADDTTLTTAVDSFGTGWTTM
ncbi:MAG: hypothetical protein PHP95_01065 [Desulfuromonadaceae bacterium]|nr:hypothetical protein [Desulfuromonadaceae bacterium]MDD2847022.1 hypothetical protein [Desulfuromonadaceae bacterium]MDD4129000.1 hypothetical protein [Desulfuromonadaceae bacterium]